MSLVVYIDDERKFDGIYRINKTKKEIIVQAFPVDKLQNLRENVLANKWYIPVKLDEALAVCLSAAIKLAQQGQVETNVECKQFVHTIVPEAFQKVDFSSMGF